MELIPVRSTAIAAIGYDAITQRMQVKFKETGTYTFCRVPESVFNDFLAARSKGSYYDRHIRDRYHC